MNRPLILLLSAALLAGAGAAQAKINLPKLNVPKLPSLKQPPFTNCLAQISDLAGGKGLAIGEYGADGAKARNLRSDYIGPPVAPALTATGKKARTPVKYLSAGRPDGVMVGAGYDYVVGADGQQSVQLNHLMIRAPYLAAGGVGRASHPSAGQVTVSVGGLVYEGEGKIDDGGLSFYISATHPVGTGYVQMKPQDQAVFARAASSQTPIQVTVADLITHAPLYSATVAVGPGPIQKAMMDQALTLAADSYAKGYDTPLCHPAGSA